MAWGGLQLSRGLILIPVVVLVISALVAFAYGAALLIWSLVEVVPHPFPVGHKLGAGRSESGSARNPPDPR